jgi:hypothetical protein
MFHIADHREAKLFAALVGAFEPVRIFSVPRRTTQKTVPLSADKTCQNTPG